MLNNFKFCPRCKNKIKHLNNRLIDCSCCNFHFYFNPYLTNAVILENKKSEILLVKRKFSPKKGWWDLPGGFVEFNETIEQSIRREIVEELNIEVVHLNYVVSTPDHYLYKGINYNTLCIIFSAQMKSNIIKASDDIADIHFFPKNNIPFSKIAFTGLVKAIKQYLSSPY